jgi:hypothetical protein
MYLHSRCVGQIRIGDPTLIRSVMENGMIVVRILVLLQTIPIQPIYSSMIELHYTCTIQDTIH